METTLQIPGPGIIRKKSSIFEVLVPTMTKEGVTGQLGKCERDAELRRKMCEYFLLLGGVMKNSNGAKGAAIAYFSAYLFVFYAEFAAMLNATNVVYGFKLFIMVMGTCGSYNLHWMLTSSKHMLHDLISSLEAGYNPAVLPDVVDAVNGKMALIYRLAALFALLTYFGMNAFPLLWFAYRKFDYDDPGSYFIPYWPLWHVRTLPVYIFTYALQSVLLLPQTLTLPLGLPFVILCQVSAQTFSQKSQRTLDELSRKIIGIKECEWRQKWGKLEEIEKDDDVIYKELKNFIRYQNYVTEAMKTKYEFVAKATNIVIFYFCIMMVVTAYGIIRLEEYTLVGYSTLFAALGAEIASIFVCCYIAETLNNLNETLVTVIYDMPWHLTNKETRGIILTILAQFQQPIHFRALGLWPVNLKLFQTIVTKVYSLANFETNFKE